MGHQQEPLGLTCSLLQIDQDPATPIPVRTEIYFLEDSPTVNQAYESNSEPVFKVLE